MILSTGQFPYLKGVIDSVLVGKKGVKNRFVKKDTMQNACAEWALEGLVLQHMLLSVSF